jgi:hypothetical protein
MCHCSGVNSFAAGIFNFGSVLFFGCGKVFIILSCMRDDRGHSRYEMISFLVLEYTASKMAGNRPITIARHDPTQFPTNFKLLLLIFQAEEDAAIR